MSLSSAAIAAAVLAAQATLPAAAPPIPARLASGGAITCRPALRHFCRNIHVGCSGRSSLRTYAFDLMQADGGALLRPHGSQAQHLGSLQLADGNGWALVRLRPGRDYVKVRADGRYSFRHYWRGVAYMSYGSCR